MNLKPILYNPIVTFLLGLGIASLFFTAPLFLIVIPCVVAMVLFTFRDRIDFGELLSREPQISIKPRKERVVTRTFTLKKCLECGAVGRHKTTCSKYKARGKKE